MQEGEGGEGLKRQQVGAESAINVVPFPPRHIPPLSTRPSSARPGRPSRGARPGWLALFLFFSPHATRIAAMMVGGLG